MDTSLPPLLDIIQSLQQPHIGALIARCPQYFVKQGTPTWKHYRTLGSTGIYKLLLGSKADSITAWQKAHNLPYPEKDLSSVPAVAFGSAMEDLVLRLFCAHYNCHKMDFAVKTPGLLQASFPFFHLQPNEDYTCVSLDVTDSPDFLCVDKKTQTVQAVGEIKTAYSREYFYDKKSLTDSYYIQCQWHMLVAGAPICYFVDCIPDNKSCDAKVLEFRQHGHGTCIHTINFDPCLMEIILQFAMKRLYKSTPDNLLQASEKKLLKECIKQSKDQCIHSTWSRGTSCQITQYIQ